MIFLVDHVSTVYITLAGRAILTWVIHMLLTYLSHVSKSNKVAHDTETQCNDGLVSTEAWSPVCQHCSDRLHTHKLYYN